MRTKEGQRATFAGIFFGAFLAFPQQSRAQEAPELAAAVPVDDVAPLVTDRPGNGNAATTVRPYRLQLETSANFLTDGGAGAKQLSFPTLLRFGIFPFLEARAGTSILGFELSEGSVEATDTLVGTKLSVPNLGLFDLAASFDFFLPSGTGAFDGGVVGAEGRVLWALGLPAGFGLLLNAGADLPDTGSGRSVRPLHVVNLSYVPPLGKERLSVFIESFARHPLDAGAPVWQFDAGLAYLLSDNYQLDAFSQHGLTDAAPDLQIALGFSGRFGR